MKSHAFSQEFLSALCEVAYLADQLVNLVLDGKSYSDVLRPLILELDRVDNHVPGDLGEIARDLLEYQYDRVEMRDGYITLFQKEEEPCPAKT